MRGRFFESQRAAFELVRADSILASCEYQEFRDPTVGCLSVGNASKRLKIWPALADGGQAG